MKHQVHVATESGIVSTEAVKQIKRLSRPLLALLMLLTPPRTVHAQMRMIWIRAAAISWSPLLRWRIVSIASKKYVLARTAHTLIWPFPALTSHGFNKRGLFDFSHVLEGSLR